MTDRNERRPGRADKTVRDIRRATRRKFSAEEKIRIVLEGLRGEETIAELCRISQLILRCVAGEAMFQWVSKILARND